MKNKMISGTLILTFSVLFVKLLGALYRIPLSNILGTEGMGLYQMIFPVYSLLLIVVSGGLPVYVSQKIAYYRANGDFKSIAKLHRAAVFLAFSIGLGFSIILLLFCKTISVFQGNQQATMGYIAISFSVFFSCLISVYRGYFQGYENMLPSALSQMLEQFTKLVLGIAFSFYLIKYGIVYGVFGALLAVTISEIICFVYVFLWHKKKKGQYFNIKLQKNDIKGVFLGFLPISLYSIVIPLMHAVDSFLVVNLLIKNGYNSQIATSLFGISAGIVAPLINFPVIFCTSICVVLLPNLSYKISKNENTNNLIINAFNFVWSFCLPCAVGMLVLAELIIQCFFPFLSGGYRVIGIYVLQISAVSVVWQCLIALSTTVLQSYQKFTLPLIGLLVCFLAKTVLTVLLVLIPNINIVGLAISNTVGLSFACIINLKLVKKNCNVRLNFVQTFIPFMASILMGIFIFYISKVIFINQYVKILSLIGLGAILYVSLLLFFKVFDIKEIKSMFKKE